MPNRYFIFHFITISWVLLISINSLFSKPIQSNKNNLEPTEHEKKYTLSDSLRGSLNRYRTWWDVQHYGIAITPDIKNKTIIGSVEIEFNAIQTGHIMQIDLHEKLHIDSVFEVEVFSKKRITKLISIVFKKDTNTNFIVFQKSILKHQQKKIRIYYHGKPQEAKNAPWDGGVIWTTDSLQQPFISVACQGQGAWLWYPCKDHLSDEPNKGMDISITTPDTLTAVSNGTLIKSSTDENTKTTTWNWQVKNPINNYNINFTIGKFAHFSDTFQGEKGLLSLRYWVLHHNIEKAKQQFKIIKPILRCFEYWFGAYPFYEDGYQIIETPFLGMEHQSGIAYGNGYKNGYKGKDLSKTKWGLLWDFILVHETGHEWFGNNISVADRADLWVHEAFSNYSETLFTEYLSGHKASNEYCFGIRNNIENKQPIIGNYGINEESNGDMYYKGGNLIHTLRNATYDDEKFRQFLRHLNKKFYHQIVTTQMIEKEFCHFYHYNFQPVFNQYLRQNKIPELTYYFKNDEVVFRWKQCQLDFNLPILIPEGKNHTQLFPTTKWQTHRMTTMEKKWWTEKALEKVFYITMKQL